jgi:hypothetical protein
MSEIGQTVGSIPDTVCLMSCAIGILRVRLKPGLEQGELVFFESREEGLALFARPRSLFSLSVVQAVERGRVRASLGPSDGRNVRRLRLWDPKGEVIFDKRIHVFVT